MFPSSLGITVTDPWKGHTGPPEDAIDKGHLRTIIANSHRVQGWHKDKGCNIKGSFFRMADWKQVFPFFQNLTGVTED